MDLQSLFDDEYGPLVSRLVFVLGGDRHAAEDLAQETLLRAWRRLPAELGGEQRRAWLRHTSRNLAVDELRRRARRPTVQIDDIDLFTEPWAGEAADSAPAREALARLNTHERFALLLRFDGGYSHAEIARVLQIGEEAARKRVMRARSAFLRHYRAQRSGSEPLILLVGGDAEPQPYIDWLQDSGARVRRVESNLRERDLATADGVVFTGAFVDIDARLYGEQPRAAQGDLDLAGDRRDLAALTHALAMDLPVLGICRGGQLLNIATGGTLYQDIVIDGLTDRAHDVQDHVVHTRPGAMARRFLGRSASVHSTHHQAVRRLGRQLCVTATSPDGVIETIERTDKRFAVGTQWHPELSDEPAGRAMAEALLQAARAVTQ